MAMFLSELSNIPPRTVSVLNKRKIFTVNDVMSLQPKKYVDYRTIKDINACTESESAVFRGRLVTADSKQSGGGREYVTIRIIQDDGEPFTVLMFNNVYQYEFYLTIKGQYVCVCGKVSFSEEYGPSVINPDDVCSASEFRPHIKTVYKKFSGVSEQMYQKILRECLIKSSEPLEYDVVKKFDIPDYCDSLCKLHFPENGTDIKTGRYRMMYNDMLYFGINLWHDSADSKLPGPCFTSFSETAELRKKLPFELTSDQVAGLNAFAVNARKKIRNSILLQGDVGCGKTIVAACCMLMAAENGYQSVLMAPRTVLAEQHYREINRYAEMTGRECIFLHSGMKAKERRAALARIASGEVLLIVGTHSCISEDVAYRKLGLVVTDEEHLFGVGQKLAMNAKAVEGYHRISMSATPIPRSVGEVIYGNTRTIVSIKTKPAGRLPVKTSAESSRKKVFAFMREQIKQGYRCYVVCPAIEDDDNGMLTSIDTVQKEYSKYFGPDDIAVINGRMKKNEISAEMEEFASGRKHVLISTTVIEVGVNVPEATVMVVEQADRFGLASLHQLRGRVGRSSVQSYCFLLSDDVSNERLQVLVATNDGFEIAEADMQQRGSGNLIGTEQSGMNRFLEEMLRYPQMFAKVRPVAQFCAERGYGKHLIALYDEHVAAEEGSKKA